MCLLALPPAPLEVEIVDEIAPRGPPATTTDPGGGRGGLEAPVFLCAEVLVAGIVGIVVVDDVDNVVVVVRTAPFPVIAVLGRL